MFSQNLEYSELSALAEYTLCLPGTNCSVKQTFFSATKTWTLEKTNLRIITLRAILLMNYNFKYSCIVFINIWTPLQMFFVKLREMGSLWRLLVIDQKVAIDADWVGRGIDADLIIWNDVFWSFKLLAANDKNHYMYMYFVERCFPIAYWVTHNV